MEGSIQFGYCYSVQISHDKFLRKSNEHIIVVVFSSDILADFFQANGNNLQGMRKRKR